MDITTNSPSDNKLYNDRLAPIVAQSFNFDLTRERGLIINKC